MEAESSQISLLHHNTMLSPHLVVLRSRFVIGARLAFGGKELPDHTIPKVYGAIQPTAVFVPLKEILSSEENFKTVTTEVFGPLQASASSVMRSLCKEKI